MLRASCEAVSDDDGSGTISNRAGSEPDDRRLDLGGRAGAAGANHYAAAAQGPAPGPDSQVQPGTPVGDVIKGEFSDSKIYPGTWREYWVYVPRQLDRSKPAPVMVFQDGLQYNAPAVFDKLIDKKEIPPIIGVFVMHGRVKAPSPEALDRMNRSYEYDAVGDDYARFLLEEMLPDVAKTPRTLNLLCTDANDRGIAGNSSGAIAAFAAAWQRPDAFRRVFSAIGTYVGLRGGNELPMLIRKTEPKPIRVFLQDGQHDLNNYTGDWFIANQDMLRGARICRLRGAARLGRRRAQLAARDGNFSRRHALAVARLAGADQGQSRGQVRPGRVSDADSRRGLATRQRGPSSHRRSGGERRGRDVLQRSGEQPDLQGRRWTARSRPVRREYERRERHDVRPRRPALWRGDPEPSDRCLRLVGHIPGDRIGRARQRSRRSTSKAICTSRIRPAKKVWFLPKGGTPRVVDEGIEYPNGVLFSPDQTLLYVSDYASQLSWAFQIRPDGSLAYKQRYFYVHMPDAATRSSADGMTVDANGNVYIATVARAFRCSIRLASAMRSSRPRPPDRCRA